jgi:hypothetical protein
MIPVGQEVSSVSTVSSCHSDTPHSAILTQGTTRTPSKQVYTMVSKPDFLLNKVLSLHSTVKNMLPFMAEMFSTTSSGCEPGRKVR